MNEKMDAKEEAVDCCVCEREPETLENFDKEGYLKNAKEKIRKRLESIKLEELKNELYEQAEKEVYNELGKYSPRKKSRSLVKETPEVSEVSKEEYDNLVAEINKLVQRNTQIVAIFTDKKECDKLAKQCLAGNHVEEFVNNEAKLHTLLDRVQSINIDIFHGKGFIGSQFGEVAKRMTCECN